MAAHDDLLQEAIVIGDRLAAEAVATSDGRTSWLVRHVLETPSVHEQFPALRSLDPTIYSGTAGLALFFANLHRFSDDRKHLKVAHGAIRHAVSRALGPDEGEPWRDGARFGLFSGVLGVAWAAHELATTWDDARLRRDARTLVANLAKSPDAPHEHDFNLGSGGAIPTLLRLHEQGVASAFPLAQRLGDDLVRNAHREQGGWSWGRLGEPWPKNLTGLSHGACGVALGLAHLEAATGEATYREAAMAGFQYERDHYSPEAKNWPDFRHPPGKSGGVSHNNYWCHGAPGIGVSRILAHSILKENELLQEARIARDTTRAYLRFQLENPTCRYALCHGVPGNAECLWLMEDGLGDGGLDGARKVARDGVDRFGTPAREEWGDSIDWPTGFYGAQPTLFRGVAGIGYFLLRAYDPTTVPSLMGPPTLAS